MPFSNFTVNTVEFEEQSPSEYHNATTSYADPADMIRIRPGAVRKDGQLSFGLTRVIEKDTEVGAADSVRKNAVVSVNVIVPKDGLFTPSEIDNMIDDLNAFSTGTRVSDILRGKS